MDKGDSFWLLCPLPVIGEWEILFFKSFDIIYYRKSNINLIQVISLFLLLKFGKI